MKNIFATAVISIFGSIGLYILLNYKNWSEASQTVAPLFMFLLLGIAGAMLTFMYILPTLSEKMSESMYAAGGEIEPDENSKAIAKIMQGDYEGAIEEYKIVAESKPGETHPVWEIAKLYAERLNDPDTAISFLGGALVNGAWQQEGSAFLINRLADLNVEHRHDYAAARSLLQRIVATMPDTRFSASASHRIKKLEDQEMQAKLAAQRKQV
jgi:tetratricopeptide (TPR) repeat protein